MTPMQVKEFGSRAPAELMAEATEVRVRVSVSECLSEYVSECVKVCLNIVTRSAVKHHNVWRCE